LIQPLQRDSEFLEDLAREASIPDELKIWWLGQSGFILRTGGSYLLLDPYLSDSLTKKYASTDKPHVRMTERVIAPELLTCIDVITSSHNHTDHLDAETLLPLFAANPGVHFIIPEANRRFVAERLRSDPGWPVGLDDGKAAELCGWRITGIASAHNEITKDESGRCLYLGYIIQHGRWTIYHSGDTLLYQGLAKRLKSFGRIDVTLLPINGNKPERRVAGNMDGQEAATLAKTIGAGVVVPHHFEMFRFNTADPRELFIPECERLDQPYRVLQAGEGFVLQQAD
jgi:L-ascorbate metabolism protein UlaG (beta-lactamase superfamily)